ncbi:MarR family winged helix-turn-helix transcriptional regulator [Terriglobus aquaticus]|uniref:MarR family winged helix-turn-helix transcriptional regulator n=1 Tax=Terriglobus aquaticus TaxID=940139 RepID=A0ABW9KG60_9BACT|nr:MarR family winged helix-turn-helix transcriptional regulator [Terriglobus aquaticus]
MSGSRRELQQEFDEWKQALPIPEGGPRVAAARQLRDSIRVFTFGFRDWLEDAMRPQGLTLPQLRMLFAVRYGSDASSAKIARLCQVTPQTLQAMLERAVREGWLLRKPAKHNARILVSALTPKGEALLQEAVEATTAFEQQVWRDASLAELKTMNAAFTRAARRIAQMEATGNKPPQKNRKPKARTKL